MITFSCSAYENIMFFNEVGQQLLSLMGHSGTVPGALSVQDLPEALNNLQQGVAKNSSRSAPLSEEEEQEPEVSLAHRAIPLINLLKAAIKQNCPVMWQ